MLTNGDTIRIGVTRTRINANPSGERVALHHRGFRRGNVLGQGWIALQCTNYIVEKLLESAGVLQTGFIPRQIDPAIDGDPVEPVLNLRSCTRLNPLLCLDLGEEAS